MSFNKNRRMIVTIATRKGHVHINERTVIKEVGETFVEVKEGEEVIMVALDTT